jgi:hypothetical protein
MTSTAWRREHNPPMEMYKVELTAYRLLVEQTTAT